MNKLVFASVISEIQQSDIFMTAKARICEAPAANLNGARVTEAFISEIVDNKERYVGLPLYADVRALTNGNYRRLGHLYDSRTGEFHSTQIGSFYEFEKEDFDDGCYLVGYARIPKRNKKLSKAISELFADGALKFSFEVSVGEYEELEDNTILIDASDSNYLEGTAIVTFPACEDAVALELVAQRDAEQSAEADDNEGGEKEMADIQDLATENVAEEQPVVAEEAVSEVNAEVEPEVNTEEKSEVKAEDETKAEEENAACKKEEEKGQTQEAEEASVDSTQENAAVYVDETHTEVQRTYAYDTETGVSVNQQIVVETNVSHVEPEASIVEADDGIHIAEDADGDPETDTPAENTEESGDSGEETGETPAENAGDAADSTIIYPEDDTRKTAEQLIAELAEQVENLKKEIAELKETKVVASIDVLASNPMMDDINSDGGYSLLQKDEKPSSYSLLSK